MCVADESIVFLQNFVGWITHHCLVLHDLDTTGPFKYECCLVVYFTKKFDLHCFYIKFTSLKHKQRFIILSYYRKYLFPVSFIPPYFLISRTGKTKSTILKKSFYITFYTHPRARSKIIYTTQVHKHILATLFVFVKSLTDETWNKLWYRNIFATI